MDRGILTRRRFFRTSGFAVAATALAACGATPTPQVIERVVTQVVEKEVTTIVEGTPQVVVETVVVQEVVKETVVVEKEVTPTAQALAEATLRLSHFEGDLGQRNYGRIAELLQNRYPQLTLSVEPTFDQAKFLVEVAAGTAPDVPYVTEQSIPVLAGKNVLLNLSPIVDVDSSFDVTAFHEKLVEYYSFQGSMFGLCRLYSPYVLWYNLNMLDAKAISYPDDSWDFETFLEASLQLAEDSDGDGKNDLWAYECNNWHNTWMSFVWGNGGALFNEDETEFLLDQDAATEALQYITDLMYKHSVAPQLTLQESKVITPFGFTTGKVAMVQNARFKLPEYTQIKDFVFDVAPVPKGAAGRFSTMPTGGFAASATTKHPQEAWECIKFLCGPEAQAIYASARQAMPSLKDFTAVALDPTLPPKNDQLFIEAIEYAKPVHRCPYFTEASAPIYSALELVWTGKETAKEAMTRAVPEANQILADLIASA
ncbi:MAG: ABC transporter substrate-binding protein [Anaerolineae bacterium]